MVGLWGGGMVGWWGWLVGWWRWGWAVHSQPHVGLVGGDGVRMRASPEHPAAHTHTAMC